MIRGVSRMAEYIMECVKDMSGIDCYITKGVLVRCRDCANNLASPDAEKAKCEFFDAMRDQDGFCSMALKVR